MANTVTDPVVTSGRSNGMAITSLVLGIVGIFLLQIILGPLAIIFGAIGLNRAKQGAKGRGMSIAGIVLGVIAVVLWVIALAVASSHGFSWHMKG